MRSLTVTQIKLISKGKKVTHLQKAPREGTRLRALFDLLFANVGKTIKLDSSTINVTPYLSQLRIFYGLDIRKARGNGNFCLVGEWYGQIYVDYACDDEQQMDLLLQTRVALQGLDSRELFSVLPENISRLSKEDAEILRRIVQKYRKRDQDVP